LIIAEATMAMAGQLRVLDGARNPLAGPDRRLAAVTDAVHAAGGLIFLQIWHGGRACHPLLNNGAQPVAPSAIPITGDEVHTPEGKKPYVTPRELRDDELPAIVAGFRKAAANARAAGFDGVEVHGANGYLLDEFLRDGANKRTGPYGGPFANRARLLCEVLEKVSRRLGQRSGRPAPVAAQQLQQHDRQRPDRACRLACRTAQRFRPRLPAPDARRLLPAAERRRADAGPSQLQGAR
jgi:N-ethylmaleimide reductase